MSCNSPLTAYRTAGGLTFDSSKATPTIRRTHGSASLRIPCNQCLGCRIKNKMAWSTRAILETQLHDYDKSWMITLTYEDNEQTSLSKRHWQLFAKRWRKSHGDFRYMVMGEYGPKTLRPHYHALVWGPTYKDRRLVKAGDNPDYTSPTLESVWGHGSVELCSINTQNANYVAGYAMKKLTEERAADAYHRYTPDGYVYGVHPEFAERSLKPAIGKKWIERFHEDVYPHDFIVIDGKKRRPPDYFDKWLEAHRPQIWERVAAKRRANIDERPLHDIRPGLDAREINQRAMQDLYERRRL